MLSSAIFPYLFETGFHLSSHPGHPFPLATPKRTWGFIFFVTHSDSSLLLSEYTPMGSGFLQKPKHTFIKEHKAPSHTKYFLLVAVSTSSESRSYGIGQDLRTPMGYPNLPMLYEVVPAGSWILFLFLFLKFF